MQHHIFKLFTILDLEFYPFLDQTPIYEASIIFSVSDASILLFMTNLLCAFLLYVMANLYFTRK
jgi:hypothetical protein